MMRKWDAAAIGLMVFSMYGLISVMMIDYNWGSGITNAFALVYIRTLGRAIPAEDLGSKAGLFFALTLLSFLILNKRQPLKENVLETLRLGSVIICLFELGLAFYVPYFMDTWVIQDFYGTPLQFFTNVDLLVAALGSLIVSQCCLFRIRSKKRIA